LFSNIENLNDNQPLRREKIQRKEGWKMRKTICIATAAIFIAIVAMAQDTDPMGNVWQRANFGNAEANYWVDQLGTTQDVAVIQDTLDHYYTQCPDGTTNSWGNGWLSKFVANLLAIRGWNLRSQLTENQENQLSSVLADAVNENTFRLDSRCGNDSWNSCSEDFVSFLSLISRVKNFYPEVVSRVGSQYLDLLEQKYLRLVFTTENGWYSLVSEQTLDGKHVIMRNHGEQSAVYSGLLLIYLNDGLSSYSLAGNRVPLWFQQDWLLSNIRNMFGWLQSVSTSDGSSFLNSCMNIQGNLVSCGDVSVTNAIPQVVPAGRLIHNLFGDNSFAAGTYEYRIFDTSYTAGNVWNHGRQADWNLDNREFSITWAPRTPRRHIRPIGPPTPPLGSGQFS
jgi:hypothetical protein